MTLSVGVLVSGRGTNLQAILDACADGSLPARVVFVASNRDGVPALIRAKRAGVSCAAFTTEAHGTRAAAQNAMADALVRSGARLIVLAGVLWGTGDLAHLLIDVGHDVRASRVLLARQTYHIAHDALHDRPFVADRASSAERVRREGTPSSPPPGGPPIP